MELAGRLISAMSDVECCDLVAGEEVGYQSSAAMEAEELDALD